MGVGDLREWNMVGSWPNGACCAERKRNPAPLDKQGSKPAACDSWPLEQLCQQEFFLCIRPKRLIDNSPSVRETIHTHPRSMGKEGDVCVHTPCFPALRGQGLPEGRGPREGDKKQEINAEGYVFLVKLQGLSRVLCSS